MTGKIEVERLNGGATILWIDNPAHRNALNSELIETLLQLYRKLERDDGCRVIVLRGRNGIFCAGRELRDVRALQSATNDEIVETYATLRELNEVIAYNSKPTVAVVEKYALGLGATIMSWCDIAIATKTALFAYPEVHYGIPPTLTAVSLFRTVGPKKAMELVLTGRKIDAAEADQIGLVTRAVPDGQLDEALEMLVSGLLRGAPDAIERTKQFIVHAQAIPAQSAMISAVDSVALGVTTDQCREGIASFLEKREPFWVRSVGSGE